MAAQKNDGSFEEAESRSCGLDEHTKEVMATVSGMDIKTRTFQLTTRSLTRLKEWLLGLA